MADDLRYRIGGDTGGIDAAWAKIKRDARTTANSIGASLGRVRTEATSLLAPLRSVQGALGALGVGVGLSQVRQMITDIADIGDVADKVGLTTDALQELRFKGEQTGVTIGTVDMAMQRFARRIAEVAAGANNDLAAILKANNVQLRDQEGNLRRQEDVLADYADLIKNARNEQDKLRLAFVAFDSEGAALVNTLKDGADGLEKNREQAQKLGVVLDRDIIARADELDKKWSATWTQFETLGKRALVSLAEGARGFTAEMNAAAGAMQDLMNDPSFRNLSRALVGDGATSFLMGKDGDARIRDAFAGTIESADEKLVAALRKRYGAATGEAAAGTIIPDKPGAKGNSTPADFMRQFREELALSNRERSIAAETQRILNDASSEGATLTQEQARALAEEAVARKEAETASKSSTKTSDKEAEALARVIDALEHELSLLGKTEVEKRIANELRNAGADAASREGERIADLVTQIEAQKAAEESLKKAQEDRLESIDNLFQMGGDALTAMVDNSLKAEDAVKRLALQLALAAAQAALLGTGPLAGLLGGGGGGSSAAKIAAGAIGLFNTGGWTGNGDPRKIAGAVHQEEFVVKAGPARQFRPMLEAINAGRDIGLYSAQQTMSDAGRSGGINGSITLHVIGEEGPMFRPTIRAESEDVAVQVSGKAVSDFNQALPDRFQQISRNPRMR
ncbi:tail tape measure protein [Nitratireductor luteus]|uniref:tail tape measure protein n=1 Tax=Nitratireductor luteus TaxID=2976980 RepID=UPI002240DAC6|nr:tail tape measure protein [Nitratireductor luteus]